MSNSLIAGGAGIGASLSGLSNVVDRLSSDLTGGGGSWQSKLRPASFRGIAFGVFESQLRFGRKTQVHEYPFRDSVWVEDLGRTARRISFAGFLVGDNCIEQRDALIKACEEAAAAEGGELVHPTLGRLTVSLADQVICVERWDRGRVFELAFSFIEQGPRQYPSTDQAPEDAVKDAGTGAAGASLLSFVRSTADTLHTGIAAAQAVQTTVLSYAMGAQRIVNDATSLVNYVQSLSGNFGRLFGQGTVRSSATTTPVKTLIAQGALARTAMQSAVDSVAAGAAGLRAVSGPARSDASVHDALQAFAGTVMAVPAVMASAAPTPADGLRLVGSLYASLPVLPVAAGAMPAGAGNTLASQAAAVLQAAAAAAMRRGCVIAQAQLAAKYQPVSREDAQAVIGVVLASIDAEVGLAGDLGEDEAYNALRSLRTAVLKDLTSRAASAAAVTVVSTSVPMPASVLAQRLYRDATRADELMQGANPIHPAFMPVSFKALTR